MLPASVAITSKGTKSVRDSESELRNERPFKTNLLKSLALPRGIEPLFPD